MEKRIYIDQGGLIDRETNEDAELFVVKNIELNNPIQPFTTDSNNKIDQTKVNQQILNTKDMVSIASFTMEPNSVIEIYIEDYDINKQYTAVVSEGDVELIKDIVYYTSPEEIGSYTVTINNQEIIINVEAVNNVDTIPVIISPIHESSDLGIVQWIVCETPTIPDGRIHTASSWQIATDADFNNIFQESPNDSTNKTSFKSDYLSIAATYYARVKYIINNIESEWSNITQFTTRVEEYPCRQMQVLKQLNTDSVQITQFGHIITVSKNGKHVFITAPKYKSPTDETHIGKVHIYEFKDNTLVPIFEITGETINGTVITGLGYSLETLDDNGDQIIVGAPFSYNPNLNPTQYGYGRLIIYNRVGNTWQYSNELYINRIHLNGTTGITFNRGLGYSMLASDNKDILLVGSMEPDRDRITAGGYPYIFRKNENGVWIETDQNKVVTPSAATAGNGRLCWSLAMNEYENTFILGGPSLSITRGESGGAMYSYDVNGILTFRDTGLTASSMTGVGWAVAAAKNNKEYFVSFPLNGNNVRVYKLNPLIENGVPGKFAQQSWIDSSYLLEYDLFYDYFGTGIVLSDDENYLYIGNTKKYGISPVGGNIHVFKRISTGWQTLAMLYPKDENGNRINCPFGGRVATLPNNSGLLTSVILGIDSVFGISTGYLNSNDDYAIYYFA